MKLSEAFPLTHAAYPQIGRWEEEFDLENRGVEVCDFLVDAQQQLLEESDEQMLPFSALVRADIIEQTRLAPNETTASCVDCVRFIAAVIPGQRTLSSGQLGDCYGWVLWGISRAHDPAARVNNAIYAVPPYRGAPRELNEAVLPFAVDWICTAYLLARKFGGLDNHCRDFFDYSTRIVLMALTNGDVRAAVDATLAIANWATTRGHPGAEALTGAVFQLSQRDSVNADTKARIEMLFLTRAAQWTDRTPVEWARHLLGARREHLREHEIFQAMAVATDDLESWTANRTDILAEIRRLSTSYYERSSRAEALISLESRASILMPLIYCLTRVGTVEDILDVLWAWYGSADRERGDSNVLFVCPNHADGVAYVWATGRWFAPHTDIGGSFEDLLIGISNALSEYFRGPAGDRVVDLDERRAGIPAFEDGQALLEAVEGHYQLRGLAEQLPHDFAPRSIVVLPGHRDPFQSLLRRETGRFAALEASLAAAAVDRPIEVLSVWPGATQLTEPELECLRAAAQASSWRLKVRNGQLDVAAFKEFYEDPEADVLWVIGHGEQSPYSVYESGLVMGAGDLLAIPHLASFAIPAPRRRLLVLNVCSSGSAQTMDGMARIGLAQELCCPHQQVIAHLWPIDYHAALAFGCSLASRLRTEPVSIAFASATEVMRRQTDLLQELDGIARGLSARERLAHEHVAEKLSNVLCWGCPALFT
ncbi:CHAT domain-containing protein [Mesorhizobium sp. M1A.F.Ca.IN.022.07.1.1]|uniref:CHAT domain-containing protein n=1 Tax=Mesorhizobium sp. M1A.F.Ca.IN.022.07.1.1 TaxID=2496767 RepID=UPI0013DFCB47|nr:CHAT domain-containing protein [Mesorhizobium sp. M1A.F.Ca.IN.022.07.1.1]